MKKTPLADVLALRCDTRRPLQLLAVGAHSDDIEIGCAGTVRTIIEIHARVCVDWFVCSAPGPRAEEARNSANSVLAGADVGRVVLRDFRDGFLPYCGGDVKAFFEELKETCSPDIIFTHWRGDVHQDHRLVGELTWNTFRDHLILEYEVPKYDGDLGSPNVFVPLSEAACHAKVDNLLQSFPSQQGRRWFTSDLFLSLMRIRGMECNSPSTYAEAFYCRKMVLGLAGSNGAARKESSTASW